MTKIRTHPHNISSVRRRAVQVIRGRRRAKALAAIEQDPYALRLAPDSIRGNRKIVLAAVKRDGWVLNQALDPLKGDKEIVLAAVRSDGDALTFAAEVLKRDKEVVLAAVHDKGQAFKHADDVLKNDPAFVRSAFEINIHAYKFLPNPDLFKAEYEGIIQSLKELDIEFPSRFKELHAIKEIIENRLNPDKIDGRPLALLVYPKKDGVNVFKMNQIAELIKHGYRVLYFEAREEKDVYGALKENTKKQKANLFVLAGHGVQERTALGAEDPAAKKGEREELYIDLSDEAEMIDLGLSNSLAGNSVIVLYSCSTGKGREDGLNVAKLMKKVFPRATVFSPTKPTYLIGYVYNRKGRVAFVEYSCGRENTYIV
ncbi:MAG: DUF4116 domain-containing protein [Candidatus Margulisiibacteriota bacterium]|nr:DUF4116 domain-containing protein [Candidatus Margulisiibacteriota bacterium]